ncbi:MAG TPA: hypothetical protein VLF62_02795 [Candidatus Saccharimonadales bacterium]|nr:hypothetical protein [Candidatus Saccharimonadales bacterium]
MEHVKVNPVAATGKPPVEFAAGTTFVDGRPLEADGGGMVVTTAGYFSVARSELAPGGEPVTTTPDGTIQVPYNRTGRATFRKSTTSDKTTMGAELEHVRMNADGTYAKLPHDYLLQVAELYNFMGESGTPPTSDPAELERFYWEMVHEQVDAANTAGEYVVALAVFGQPVESGQINPHPYVQHVAAAMTERTGFDTLQAFRTGGAQAHTGLSDSMAGIKTAEAMQYLSPLLMAPTMSGPLLRGGMAGNLPNLEFTAEQQAHLARMGITRDDLSGPYQSYRYLLRMLGSPSAGVWQAAPPDTRDGYVTAANARLRTGAINTIDRTNGWHADRVRLVLDGKGANTIEDCSADPALGNANVLAPLHVLRSAITTVLEAMAMRGEDPRTKVAEVLGISGISRTDRLRVAGGIALREVSRYGNDAATYKGKRPGGWLGTLLELAGQAPHLQVTEQQTTTLRRAYATQNESAAAIRAWCGAHGTDAPTAQTYFDLGLGTPAQYMNGHYMQLRTTHPAETAVRTVELTAGIALHQASYRKRQEA